MRKRVYLIGYMGCGKSTIGRFVAQQTALNLIDLDGFIEEKYHKTIADIFAEKGQDGFREIERKALLEVSEFENVIIATGGGAPCFFDNMEVMNRTGLTIYIQMSADQLASHLELSKPGKRPLIAGKTGAELRAFIQEGLNLREPFYTKASQIVQGSDEEIFDRVFQAVLTGSEK